MKYKLKFNKSADTDTDVQMQCGVCKKTIVKGKCGCPTYEIKEIKRNKITHNFIVNASK